MFSATFTKKKCIAYAMKGYNGRREKGSLLSYTYFQVKLGDQEKDQLQMCYRKLFRE